MDGPQYGKVPLGRVRWSVFGGVCVCVVVCLFCNAFTECLLHHALALVSVCASSVRAAFVRDVL